MNLMSHILGQAKVCIGDSSILLAKTISTLILNNSVAYKDFAYFPQPTVVCTLCIYDNEA